MKGNASSENTARIGTLTPNSSSPVPYKISWRTEAHTYPHPPWPLPTHLLWKLSRSNLVWMWIGRIRDPFIRGTQGARGSIGFSTSNPSLKGPVPLKVPFRPRGCGSGLLLHILPLASRPKQDMSVSQRHSQERELISYDDKEPGTACSSCDSFPLSACESELANYWEAVCIVQRSAERAK